jgi:hypothetical protein
MAGKYHEEPLLDHLVVCITFFYVPERLTYLTTIIANYIGIAGKTDIYIVTNIADVKPIIEVLPYLPEHMTVRFFTPSGIGHPYLLSWSHREIFQNVLAADEVTHFMYSEDDLLFTRSNVAYWLRYREPLQGHGHIPSFFRVESHRERGWVSADSRSPIRLSAQPKLVLNNGALFVCMPNPYQAMYFLDRPLMQEFAASQAISPDFGKWLIREKAAQGLTYVNVPKGFTSRNLVLFDPKTQTVANECWVHHLPNTYANKQKTKFRSLPMQRGGLFKLGLYDRLKLSWTTRKGTDNKCPCSRLQGTIKFKTRNG